MATKADYDKALTRLLIILRRLYEGESLSVKELAEEFNVSEKTVQRDFNDRLALLPIEKEGRRWKMMEGHRLEKTGDPEEQMVLDMVETLSLELGSTFGGKAQHLLKKIKNLREDTLYARLDIEDIGSHTGLIQTIDSAIRDFRFVSFHYKEKKRTVAPYRIVNFDGYWYLLGIEEGKGKTFHLKTIELLSLTDETFTPDSRIQTKMESALNAWFEPDKELFEVQLHVQKEIVKYLERRPISPFQKTLTTHKDGSLDIAIPVTSDKEILPSIRQWMPHLLVIAPTSLKTKALDLCNRFAEFQNELGRSSISHH